MSESTTLLRHEPVQARSNARLSGLLDAAATTIDNIGYERLTTAMVAEKAGASIGTVYRYFPDRIAVLQGVAARASDRFLDSIDATLTTKTYPDWLSAVDDVVEALVEAFDHQPAFASLRFGDVLDLRPRERGNSGIGVLASRTARTLVLRHEGPSEKELTFHLDVVFTLVDTLLARAFAFAGNGDLAYIDEARAVTRLYLANAYGSPSAR